MKAATLELQDEHDLISRMLSTLDWLVVRLESGASVDDSLVMAQLEFVGNFVAGCHHRKEEELVFPIMDRRGGDEAELASRLREEHRRAEELLETLRSSWSSGDATAAARTASELASLLRDHIDVENTIAFAYVEMALTDDEKDALIAELERFNRGTRACDRARAEGLLDDVIRQISSYA